MPTLTYNYAYFAGGKHQRQPRAKIGGGLVVFESDPVGTLQSGTPFKSSQLPQTELVNGKTFNFSFMTVSGGLDPLIGQPVGRTSFDPLKSPDRVNVGNDPITVLAVYVPAPGIGRSVPEVSIDAFDETTGALFDDDFVSVAPDGNGQETQNGNEWGYVDTNTAETITALSSTSSGKSFSRWVTLSSPATSSTNKDLMATQGASFAALAFYEDPASVQVVCQTTLATVEKQNIEQKPHLTKTQWDGTVKPLLHNCVNEGYLPAGEVNNAIQRYEHLLTTSQNPMKP